MLSVGHIMKCLIRRHVTNSICQLWVGPAKWNAPWLHFILQNNYPQQKPRALALAWGLEDNCSSTNDHLSRSRQGWQLCSNKLSTWGEYEPRFSTPLVDWTLEPFSLWPQFITPQVFLTHLWNEHLYRICITDETTLGKQQRALVLSFKLTITSICYTS